MSTPYEWRINDIEQNAKRACDRLWKVDSLAIDVDRLEHTVRELSTCIDGLRGVCEAQQTRIEQLERTLEEIHPQVT